MCEYTSCSIQSEPSNRSVVWLCMPWQSINNGSLGLSLLKSVLEEADYDVDIFYFNLLFASEIGQELYQQLQNCPHAAEMLFTPMVFGLKGAALEHWLKSALPIMVEESGVDAATFRRLVYEDVPKFLDVCEKQVEWSKYSVVGYCLVYNQNMASIALANRIKQCYPMLSVLVGGASAYGIMGEQIVADFASIDVAVQGEAECIILPLIESLADNRVPDQIPGIAYREVVDGKCTVVSSPRPPKTDLNALPMPKFDDYFQQRASYNFQGDLWVSFESSRGCWWGEQVICSFCGLNGELVAYRTKSPDRVVQEIRCLYETYGVRFFSATDNILPRSSYGDLLPTLSKLAEVLPDLYIFYQIKSNITRKHARMMREAGIGMVQPGIESFSKNILQLMFKGASPIIQIQCLKFLTEEGFDVIYGILHGSFGEKASDYEEQLALIPFLKHLVPPSYFTKIKLDRFSPYHENPETYGLEDLKPTAALKYVYPSPRVNLMNLARSFDATYVSPYDEKENVALQMAIERLEVAVTEWQETYVPGKLFYSLTSPDSLYVRDRREEPEILIKLDAIEQQVFLHCEEACLRKTLGKKLHHISSTVLEASIESLWRHGFLLKYDDWLLTLPVRRDPKKIWGLTGRSCAGKTAILDILKEKGYKTFDVGAVLMTLFGYENYALPPKEKLQRFGKGESIFHVLEAPLQKQLEACDILFVDSLKAARDLEVLRSLFPDANVELILVDAPLQVREKRFGERNRPGDEATLEMKDQKITDIGINELIKKSSFVINNNGSYSDLLDQIERLLQEMKN